MKDVSGSPWTAARGAGSSRAEWLAVTAASSTSDNVDMDDNEDDLDRIAGLFDARREGPGRVGESSLMIGRERGGGGDART